LYTNNMTKAESCILGHTSKIVQKATAHLRHPTNIHDFYFNKIDKKSETPIWFVLWSTFKLVRPKKLPSHFKRFDEISKQSVRIEEFMTGYMAQNRCNSIKGHLPLIKSPRDERHLLDVLFGMLDPSELFKAPCRYVAPVCSVFIGMNPRKECTNCYYNILSKVYRNTNSLLSMICCRHNRYMHYAAK